MKGKPRQVPWGPWKTAPGRSSEPPTLPPLYREPSAPPRGRSSRGRVLTQVVVVMFVLAVLLACSAVLGFLGR